MERNQLLIKLVEMQYERNDVDFVRGTFRVRGDSVEILTAQQSEKAVRVEFFGDEIDRICEVDVLTGRVLANAAALCHFSQYPLCGGRTSAGKSH